MSKFAEINWREFCDNRQLNLIDNHLKRVGTEEEFRLEIVNKKLLSFSIKKEIFRIKLLGITIFKTCC